MPAFGPSLTSPSLNPPPLAGEGAKGRGHGLAGGGAMRRRHGLAGEGAKRRGHGWRERERCGVGMDWRGRERSGRGYGLPGHPLVRSAAKLRVSNITLLGFNMRDGLKMKSPFAANLCSYNLEPEARDGAISRSYGSHIWSGLAQAHVNVFTPSWSRPPLEGSRPAWRRLAPGSRSPGRPCQRVHRGAHVS